MPLLRTVTFFYQSREDRVLAVLTSLNLRLGPAGLPGASHSR
jgi:hypothetical protein